MASLEVEHRVWKAHMKMALSNERTLIAWVRVGATYGAGAVVAAVITTDPDRDPAHRQTSISLTVQALLGLLIVAWGVVQFVRRGKMLAARWHGSYEAHVGPAAFAIATIVSVLLTVRRGRGPRGPRAPCRTRAHALFA